MFWLRIPLVFNTHFGVDNWRRVQSGPKKAGSRVEANWRVKKVGKSGAEI